MHPHLISLVRTSAAVTAILLLFTSGAIAQQDQVQSVLHQQYATDVLPLLQQNCYACHNTERRESELVLTDFRNARQVARQPQLWSVVLDRLEAGEMPPADSKSQLTAEQRQTVIQWIRALRSHEAQRDAGAPGPVYARRLSNAEYSYTIRDLTGVDIRPTHDFPVDPANEAGFDNSAESLAMSPALVQKYLDAARRVADHMLLTPSGISFAPHAVTTDTDRDKYCVRRIVDFYLDQPTDLAEYLLAAREYHRDSPAADLSEIAERHGISAGYLATLCELLTAEDAVGVLHWLQQRWRALPADPQMAAEARRASAALRDEIHALRARLKPSFDNLHIEGVHKGAQPFVLWKNDQYAANRRSFDPAALIPHDPFDPASPPDDPLAVPVEEDQRAAYVAAVARFCSVIPDAFYIAERGRDYLDKPTGEEKGRLLSAGFHSMMGYYRDDQPLYDLILDDRQREELDRLWRELNFITAAPIRQYTGFLWFERTDSRFMRDPEFDFARPEDKDALSETNVNALAEVYLAKARRNGGQPVPLQAIEDYFRNINSQIRWVEEARRQAEPAQVQALIELATRAFRRPLADAERRDLTMFYRELREKASLTHEEAMQDLLVSVLMSPHFCYRMDLASQGDEQPLSDYDLASRLSYFLWSSMPDEQLLRRAAAGELRRPDVLQAEAERMLQDPRVEGMITEFAGNWLDFRRFEEHNAVDRGHYPEFDDALRRAMFEEPIRFLADVIQRDRPLCDLLLADDTFVNPVLARHYGFEVPVTSDDHWAQVPDAAVAGRGGLLPMAVFLTKNAPGLRTSPVKRGYWVVRRLLGEHIPAPPPDVPELPASEAELGELSLPELLARHREHQSCAGCHDRFDSVGLAFEGFGPVGERRAFDLAGRLVEDTAVFPDGSQGTGVSGLKEYLARERQGDFLDTFCRKLLSYALGRMLRLSDEPLLEQMQQASGDQTPRFSNLVNTIVTSRQFRHKRGREPLAEDASP